MLLLENITEEFAWVDKLLEAKYYDYALNEDNVDDFIEAGFIIDNRSELTNNSSSNNSSSNNSSSSQISNPFCNIEVEQRFNSLIHTVSSTNSLSDISDKNDSPLHRSLESKNSDSEEDTIFLEYMDGYDSDDFYQRFSFTADGRIFCYY